MLFVTPAGIDSGNCSYGFVERGRLSIVTVSGSVGIDTVPCLKALLIGCIRRHRHVVLCMADVRRIDSAGVAVLLGVSAAARTEQVELVLVDISSSVQRLFEVYLVDRLFRVCDSLAGAEHHIAAARGRLLQ